MALTVGTVAPDFTLVDQGRAEVSLRDLRGRKVMLVFMPFPHTRVCEGEGGEIRDNWSLFEEHDIDLLMITTHAVPTNRDWASRNQYPFRILADYWPHGAVAQAYDCFDDTFGYARRTTYLLDEDGVVREVVSSDELGEARPFDAYREALARFGRAGT